MILVLCTRYGPAPVPLLDLEIASGRRGPLEEVPANVHTVGKRRLLMRTGGSMYLEDYTHRVAQF